MKILHFRDVRGLYGLREGSNEWKRLSNTLKNVQITVFISPTIPKRRPQPILKLEAAARTFEFNRPDRGMITVEVYLISLYWYASSESNSLGTFQDQIPEDVDA